MSLWGSGGFSIYFLISTPEEPISLWGSEGAEYLLQRPGLYVICPQGWGHTGLCLIPLFPRGGAGLYVTFP